MPTPKEADRPYGWPLRKMKWIPAASRAAIRAKVNKPGKVTEQHLVDLRLRILDSYNRDEVPMKEVFRWYTEDLALDVETLPSWPTIHELRLVANAIKHAEGWSVKELEKLRPDLFDVLQIKDVPGVRFVGRRVRKPLFGQEIYIGPEDFRRYHDASVAFWTELADALPALSKQ